MKQLPDKEVEKVLEDLKIARETNRRLNRRVQKLEQRINRWESRRYTINRWRGWLISWYRREKERADKLEWENKKLKKNQLGWVGFKNKKNDIFRRI